MRLCCYGTRSHIHRRQQNSEPLRARRANTHIWTVRLLALIRNLFTFPFGISAYMCNVHPMCMHWNQHGLTIDLVPFTNNGIAVWLNTLQLTLFVYCSSSGVWNFHSDAATDRFDVSDSLHPVFVSFTVVFALILQGTINSFTVTWALITIRNYLHLQCQPNKFSQPPKWTT